MRFVCLLRSSEGWHKTLGKTLPFQGEVREPWAEALALSKLHKRFGKHGNSGQIRVKISWQTIDALGLW
jgi:hypothetical protein